MARIPQTELDRIKHETDLIALVGRSGVELKRHGADWIGLCPFHDDHEPSLVVTPKKNLWHCLGACQAGGSAIDWVMRAEGMGFRQAVKRLRSLSQGVPPELVTTSPAAPRSAAEPPPPPPAAEDQALLGEVVKHYHERLLTSETALAYLEKRGLRDDEAIERFRLGVADRTLGTRLSAEGSQGRAKRERLKALGVLREATGHEHLAGCLVVPILGPGGEVLNLYGRRIGKVDQSRGPAHLYLAGPRRGVWNLTGLADSKEVILCEALLDALTFWSAGFRNVTCSYGIQGFTDEHLEAFRAYGIERVLIAYDRDEAGETAAAALAKKLAGSGLSCSRVLFPKGMDANAYAVKVTPAKESLTLVLQAAEPRGEPKKSAAKEETPAPSLAAARSESRVPEPVPPTAPAIPDPLETTIGDRRWKIRGLSKNLSFEQLKVVVRVGRLGTTEAFFLDTVDLVSAKQRAAFLRHAASELEIKEEILKRDLGKIHMELEAHQERLIEATLEPKQDEPPPMAPEAERSALSYLTEPGLLDRILEDFDRCGIVGEETNKLVGYLAAVSRKLEAPLAIVIQSSSAAGKSSLMDAILALVPEEDRVQYSAMTGQSLFYMGETDLKHKILALVEEEGAERAVYALKLLQSEGELTIASTGKDPETGKLVTHEYRVEGPVMLFLTTTSIEIDEELLNRCLVLSVDESREQTRAIHKLQRERRTLDGMLSRRRRAAVVELHRNVQRLLKPLPIVNPYARELTFLDSQTRTRRDHEKYLTLIEAIALLHQYQRPRKTATDRGETVEYLEVELSDIETANRLASEVLGRSLDELPPQTRTFLEDLDRYVSRGCERLETDRADYRFHRREIAEGTDWSYSQTRKHLERLVELEYVLTHRGGRGQSFVYELLWLGEGDDGERFLMQLIDAEALRTSSSLTPKPRGLTPSTGEFDPPLTPHVPPNDPPLTPGRNGDKSNDPSGLQESEPESPQKALIGESQMEIGASYSMRAGARGTARGSDG